jgi:hypothetical protein
MYNIFVATKLIIVAINMKERIIRIKNNVL